MSMILDGTNGVTFNDASLQGAAASPFGMKNRIINGDMRIDQRNAGASVTLGNGVGTYTLDRFSFYKDNSSATVTSQQSTVAPTNFNNSLLVSVTTGAASSAAQELVLVQQIEGFNVADFGFGAIGASSITLSFWVRSSLTGTFAGSLSNNGASRTYIFTYSISAANTWEQKTITVAGDTTGTWVKNNGSGLVLKLDLGAGSDFNGTANSWIAGNLYSVSGATKLMATTGATFYITGVQLEIGTSATPFERRLYNQELANCQRYYQKLGNGTIADIVIGSGISRSSTIAAIYVKHNIPMRAAPTITQSSLVVTDAETYNATVTSISINASTSESRVVATCSGGGMTQYRPALLSQITSGTGYLDLSAEL